MHTVMLHQYLAVLPSLNNILDKFSIPQTGSSLGSNCTCVALCAAWGSQEEVTANATLLKCCYLPLDEYTHARVRACVKRFHGCNSLQALLFMEHHMQYRQLRLVIPTTN
jgi:hypothetical protein